VPPENSFGVFQVSNYYRNLGGALVGQSVAMIVISHDRYFVEKLKVGRTIELG
jgi:ATPase subunit of ABC transporter with duplicated ATPase domains